MTDIKLNRMIWIFVGLTFPLFCVPWGRYDIGPNHIAVPMVMLAFSGYFGFIYFLVNQKYFPDSTSIKLIPKGYGLIILLAYLFWIMHLFSISQSYWFMAAVKELVELTLALFCFVSIIAFFPRDKNFVRIFWFCNILALSLILAFLIYRYAIVFKQPFLAPEWSSYEEGRRGKNDLALYTARLFPFALFFAIKNMKSLLGLGIFFVHMVALIYCISRGAWAAAGIGTIMAIGFVYSRNKDEGLKLTTVMLITLSILFLPGMYFLSQFIDLTELSARFFSVVMPNLVPHELQRHGSNSIDYRSNLVYEAYQGFLTSPVIGVGLKNTRLYVSRITHNDYACILLEFGIIGIGIFMSIIAICFKKIFIDAPRKMNKIDWDTPALRAAFIAHIIASMTFNSYISIYYWSFLAMFLVHAEIEAKQEEVFPTKDAAP